MAFEDLQKPVGTIDLLLYLHRHGKASVTTATSETGINKDTFYNAVDRLVSLGFAYREEPYGFPKTVLTGLTPQGEAMARALLPAAEILAATEVSLERELARLREANDPATAPRRMEVLDVVSGREFSLGRWERAEAAARELADLAHASGDPRREARGRLGLGRILQKRDRHGDAARELAEALGIAERAGDLGTASEAEYLLGSDLERQGRWPEAAERFEAAAARAARGDDPLRAARAKLAKGRILARTGRVDDAVALFTETIPEFERLVAWEDLGRAYTSLGSALYLLDRPDAGTWLEKAIASAVECGDVRMEAYARSNASAQLMAAREFKKADAYLRRARQVFEDLDERTGLGAAELNTANLYRHTGRWSEADERFDRAVALARETGNRRQEASALFNRGLMERAREHPSRARGLLTRARGMFLDLGAESQAALCAEQLRDLTRPGTRRRSRPGTRRSRSP